MPSLKIISSYINKYCLYLVFIVLYLWRPFNLGFYSDDWGYLVGINQTPGYGPFSFHLFKYFSGVFLNRPGQIPFFYLFSSLFSDNTFLWQSLSVFLMLISALVFRNLIILILKLYNIKSSFLSNIIPCFWLSMPWMLGISAWIVCSPAILSTILFILSGYYLLKSWYDSKNYYLISALFLFLSYSLYEAFFFQYIIFIFIGFTIKFKSKIKWKSIIIPAIFLSISQFISLVLNRFATTGSTPTKSFYSGWYVMLTNYLQHLPEILLNSTLEFRSLIIIIIKIILEIFIVLLVYGIYKKNLRVLTIKFCSLILFSLFGYFISIWIYSITGYGIFSLGPLSRTTLSLSFWLVIILFFVISYCVIILPNILKKSFYFCTLILLIIMIISTFLRTMDWSKAWKLQQTILSQAPLDKLIKIEKDATVVYITPNVINEAFVFLAGYDLNIALLNKYPEIKNQLNFCPHIPQLNGLNKSSIYWSIISWDGATLYYNNGIYSKTHNIYIWDYYNRSFTKIDKPFTLENRELKPFKSID